MNYDYRRRRYRMSEAIIPLFQFGPAISSEYPPIIAYFRDLCIRHSETYNICFILLLVHSGDRVRTSSYVFNQARTSCATSNSFSLGLSSWPYRFLASFSRSARSVTILSHRWDLTSGDIDLGFGWADAADYTEGNKSERKEKVEGSVCVSTGAIDDRRSHKWTDE